VVSYEVLYTSSPVNNCNRASLKDYIIKHKDINNWLEKTNGKPFFRIHIAVKIVVTTTTSPINVVPSNSRGFLFQRANTNSYPYAQ
jgi:hypothetical protein